MNVFTWSRKIIFVDCKRKFAQDVHGCMGIFTEKTWLIFCKGNIREPMQGFDFPVFADCCQQFSDWGIGTENIITSITCTNAIFLRAKISFSKRFWIEFGVHLKKRRKRNRSLFRRFVYRTQAWIITSLVSFSFVTLRSRQYRRFPMPKFHSISPRSPDSCHSSRFCCFWIAGSVYHETASVLCFPYVFGYLQETLFYTHRPKALRLCSF